MIFKFFTYFYDYEVIHKFSSLQIVSEICGIIEVSKTLSMPNKGC